MIGNILGGAMGKVAPTGDYESIATVTVGAGGATDITFSSIPSTYQHLQLRMISRGANSTNTPVLLQFNSDTTTVYARHWLTGNGTSASASAQTGETSINSSRQPGSGDTSNTFGAVVIDILDYKDTNKFTTIRSLSGYDTNGAGEIHLYSGLWRSTSAVTTIKLYASTGNLLQYSQAALYGIKG